jgi:PAN domain
MVRRGGITLLCCLALLTVAALAAPAPARAQVGFDRRGGDYTNFPLPSGDPAQCAGRCDRDPRCRAWAFSYPATESAAATCWLKSRVTPRVASSCCASGVRGASVIEPHSEPVEFGIDRVGGDIRSLEVAPDPTGKTCAAECSNEAQCRAWTYIRPGYFGTAAVCFLKERVTSPQHRPCCISGVIR